MATHSSILPGESPWTEEPGGLQSMESQRVGHDCSDLAQAPVALVVKNSPANAGDERYGPDPWAAEIPWRKEWLATHSSVLAWKIPRAEEPGGLQCLGWQRVD